MTGHNATSLFDEIYDSTHKKVLALITAKCPVTADIGDLFQETYSELFSVLKSHSEGYVKSPEAFVMTLAKRKLAKYYSRRERKLVEVSFTAVDSDGDEADLSELAPDSFCVEDAVIDADLLERVRSFIAKKDEATKKIFYLCYSLDLTLPQISELLGVGESFVKNRLYRTLKELRAEYLGKEEF